MLEDLFTRIWENMISRVEGPMKFRFLLQPVMAVFFAIRCGLKDSREGKPAYLWALCTDPAQRRERLKDGWKSIGRVVLLALVLDCIFQLIVLHWIYPGEAMLIAIVLAIVPYLLVRGPVNRIASARKKAAGKFVARRGGSG